MSILQKFLIPRHGNQSVMADKSSLVLKRGEFFIETPNNGPGSGHCKIKIGDGVTPYPTLPYAMGDTNAEVSSSLITFDSNSSAKPSDALGAVVSGAQLKDMIAGFKQSISLLISAQKSFTTITDGTSSIHASSAADTLKITGGTNTTVSYDVSGKTISISSKDTTYGAASSTNAGITKLYSNTGTSVDGTMTQKAITDNINTKLDANTVDYIKNIKYVDHTATVTFGNGSTTSFNTADNNTTYDVFKGTDGKAAGHYGLVPTPSTADSNKYLSSNGTWGDFNSVKVANASKADIAISDAGGNNINSTYVKNVTYSGHTVTITKGNGTTSSFDTADNNNTYSAGSGITLTGSQFAINPNASTVSYATTAASADKATDDSDGQAINATYIKNAAVNGRTVTFTKGNGSTFAITTQDTDTDTKYTAGSGLSLSGNAFSINQGASTVAYATSAGSASKATSDSAGNNINATYIKDVSVDGRNVTFTKGNGTTVGIVTQDTNTDTDTKYTAGSGLSLTGTSFSINPSASTVAYATSAASATKATNDSAGNNINSTYIKDVAVSGRNVTFTKGNGSTVGIVTQDTNTDTTYKTGTTSSSGLTKLYTGTGTALDGTMTQNAITNLVNSTKSELNSAIGAINSFEIVVLDTVDDLPATGTAHTVYFVPDDTGSGENVYDEFVWLPSTSSYEQIGVTTADLSKYYTKTDVDSKISSTKNSLVKNITYSGHTVTVTFGNGSTTSFNTADNNTTYDAGTGLSLSGNTFSINSGASTVAYAGKAGSANSAGAATNDSAGNDIHNTYIKDVSVNGRNITFTKGNGSTVGIVTQDTNTDTNTTYSAGTGLSLTGTSFSINQGASTVAYATTAGTASKATNDSAGNDIHNTYIANATVSGRTVTFTKGNGSTFSILTQDTNTDTDTKYSAGTGLVLSGTTFSLSDSASTVAYAKNSGWASSAGAATNDGAGNNINTTYIKNVTVNGRTVTFTKGNGSTFAITTQDTDTNTTYAAGTGISLSGNTFSINQGASTVSYASNSGSAGSATKATNDGAGNNINSTYIKNATVNGRTVTFTKGNGSTFAITTQDNNTTYSAGTGLSLSGTSFSINPNASTVTYASNANYANSAGAATNDSAGHNINNTYISNVTVSGRTVTFTKGNGSTFSIVTQDTNTDTNTTYTAGSGLALSGTSFSINENASTVSYAKNANWANGASYSNYIGGAGVSTNALRDNTCFDFGYEG